MKKTLAMVLAMGMTICEPDSMRRKQAGRRLLQQLGNRLRQQVPAADTKAEATEPAGGKAEGPITVVSREDGSGTRGAFIRAVRHWRAK